MNCVDVFAVAFAASFGWCEGKAYYDLFSKFPHSNFKRWKAVVLNVFQVVFLIFIFAVLKSVELG